MIKNIIFDMGGVLVGFDRDRCISAFQHIGAHKIAVYVDEFRTEDLFERIERGDITQEEFCQEAREIVGLPLNSQQIVDAWNALLTPCTDEKKQKLLQLKQHYRLFLLSNTNIMHWEYCRDKLIGSKEHPITDYFEQCFLSYEMQCVKPHKDIFEQALLSAGLKAEETLFIDDSLVNLEGAASLGIHTFHETEGHRWIDLIQ